VTSVLKDHLRFAIKNKLKEITDVDVRFELFANKNAIPSNITYRINFALGELLSNIISYAYSDNIEHIIDIAIDLHEDKLRLTITDDGIAYNPLNAAPPDTSVPLADRQIGGLGIYLVRNLTDEFAYQRQQDKNQVMLSVYLS
jgi:anti-sigma regulatory factor (Ser/Thr protein kinase)